MPPRCLITWPVKLRLRCRGRPACLLLFNKTYFPGPGPHTQVFPYVETCCYSYFSKTINAGEDVGKASRRVSEA
jgi:hypothetical protein